MTTGLTYIFQHHLWANLSLLDACSKLNDEQLDATTNGVYGSIRATLLHMLSAEGRYVARLTGQPSAFSEEHPFPGFAVLRQQASSTGEALLEQIEQGVEHRTLHISHDGQTFEYPGSFMLLQAINHATDHRSQICTQLTLLGITPPDLDGWSYYDAQH